MTIVGAPAACSDGVRDPWRELSGWAAGRLRHRFGNAVEVEYHDLFDPACPPIPRGAELPLVLVEGEVLTSGGKLSLPHIRRAVEARLAEPVAVGDRAGSAPAG